ncbi:peptidyl-prolyl cis-trans isomerase [Bradyrhizobium liaoningense]|uniref:peptidylprolyl isomerase n=1 Tax=Bradyrhizobium liaoningense TaxID=43992 RepID=UPI001BABACAF|nr:peptidylprolyl isomerase [Bradyrhizobium liaoningense]MBR0718571.1 peptidyl-prolyl cis-trans isomerase [Bradyrhizobium liaoningense]
MKRLLREPLVHFLVLGAILFGVNAYAEKSHSGADRSKKEIALTIDDLSQLVLVFRSQWRRDPTPEDLRLLVEDKVQEEVLYREALALGIDKDDTIVKRRMAQKMQFLAEDVAAAREPARDELAAWYEANRDRFASPPRVSFRHLYFSPDRRGERARYDAASALTRLADEPEDSKLVASLADAFMFQDYYRDRAPEFLGKEFGPSFALAVVKLPAGSWQGPVESGFGWHLVYVDALTPARAPAFEEVEADVKAAWLAEQKVQAWRKTYEELRAKYKVLLPAPAENASANKASANGDTSRIQGPVSSSGRGS